MKRFFALGMACLLLAGCSTNEVEKESDEPYEIVETNFDDVILEEVPNFEDTPIALYHDGYLVKVDGKYGFIDNDGQFETPAEYDQVFHFGGNDNITLIQDDHDKMIGLEHLKPNPLVNGCEGPQFVYGYGEDVGIVKYDLYLQKLEKLEEKLMFEVSKVYPYDENQNDTFLDDVFQGEYEGFYLSDRDEIYGPYDYYEEASYAFQKDENVQKYYPSIAYGGYDGLFYTKEDGGYRLHSIDTRQESELVFDKVEFLSDTSAKVYFDGYIGIVDNNCNLVIAGKVDDLSEPINGRAYVKKNDTWQLVRVQSYQEEELSKMVSEICTNYVLKAKSFVDAEYNQQMRDDYTKEAKMMCAYRSLKQITYVLTDNLTKQEMQEFMNQFSDAFESLDTLGEEELESLLHAINDYFHDFY